MLLLFHYKHKARLPTCFAKEYGVALDDYVMLRDPKRNVTVVQVEKKNGKVYLDNL